MIKRVGLLAMILAGALAVSQPAAAQGRDWDNGYRHFDRHEDRRDWDRQDRREHEWREHQREEWREHERWERRGFRPGYEYRYQYYGQPYYNRFPDPYYCPR
jgi:Ni/Co efflux regulator RcnB